MTITDRDLHWLLDYNPETGDFFWARKVSNRSPAGSVAGTTSSHGYRVISIRDKNYGAHRLVWLYMTGAWPTGQIDHINGDRSDNRIENLRDVNPQTNVENQRQPQRNNKCGLMGASAYRDKWRAQISCGGKVLYLGLFETPEFAHGKYLSAKRALHAGCTI